jgi:hypothetical protein
LTLPAPGSAGSIGGSKSIVIDTTAPTVTAVTSTTANGTYGVGAVITITVGWSEPVVVTGTPQLALNSGGTASYTSGTGTSTLTFTYTVAAGQNSPKLDYTSTTALSLNGGTIFDTVTTNPNAAVLTLPAPGSAGSIGGSKSIVIDTTAATVTAVSANWGTTGAIALQDASGGRLLPAGRNTDLPWYGINKLQITLSKSESLSAGDVSVKGITVLNYGPVTISGSGTSYTITLAQAITTADRVTVTIGNSGITTYKRRIDVLPGDANDDGVVNAQDLAVVRNDFAALGSTYNIFDDINGDGTVDINDTNLVGRFIGKKLPPLI